MPLRPPAFTWGLSKPFDSAAFDRATSALAKQLGWGVEFQDEGGIRYAVMSASPDRLKASAETLDAAASLEELDPPEGEQYALVVARAPPDDDWPAHRLIVDPETKDNWAAWGVAGVAGERVANALKGREITGDLPPWLSEELQRNESPFPEELPALALRGRVPFPGFVIPLTFGRPASVATVRKMLADNVYVPLTSAA